MVKNDVFYLENRKLIYDNIREYPGIHLGELVRKTNFSEGTVRYHIKYFDKRDLIRVEEDGGYIRFYLKKDIGNEHAKILNIIRKETPRRILLTMLVAHVFSKKQFSKILNKNPATIQHHFENLEKSGVIEKANIQDNTVKLNYCKNGRTMFVKVNRKSREIYYILKNPYLIYDVFILYEKKLFDDKLIQNLLDIYRYFSKNSDYIYGRKKKCVVLSHDSFIDNLEKFVLKYLFPMPFIA